MSDFKFNVGDKVRICALTSIYHNEECIIASMFKGVGGGPVYNLLITNPRGAHEEVPMLFAEHQLEALEITAPKNPAATKHDSGKPDMTLLPYDGLLPIVAALEFGAKKYGRDNYTKGLKYTRLLAAALRHIYAYTQGEDLDPESGINHLGHAGACMVMLMKLIKFKGPEWDDRKEDRT